MGRFVNPDNSAFQDVLNSKVYVDQVSNRCNSSPTLEVGVFLLEEDKSPLYTPEAFASAMVLFAPS